MVDALSGECRNTYASEGVGFSAARCGGIAEKSRCLKKESSACKQSQTPT